jgi:hypothetical protein
LHAWIAATQGGGSIRATGLERARVLRQLEASSQKQLVLVRYRSDHDPLQEWVYNGADIDGSKVVWARDMGPEQNEKLIRYYKGRRVWVVEVDDRAAKLEAYPSGEPQNSERAK